VPSNPKILIRYDHNLFTDHHLRGLPSRSHLVSRSELARDLPHAGPYPESAQDTADLRGRIVLFEEDNPIASALG
jgi:hypothetical protein